MRKYEPEIVCDFRHFFSVSAYQAGFEFSHREGIILATKLGSKPSSEFAAKLNGWKKPLPDNFNILADIFELLQATAGAKPHQVVKYPRPYDKPAPTISQGLGGGEKNAVLTKGQMEAIFRRKNVRIVGKSEGRKRSEKP